jgi:hypothetical protein
VPSADIAARLAAVEAALAAQDTQIQRLQATVAVQNLMSSYQYYHSAYRNDLIVDLFADRDDLLIEMPAGVWRGRDAAYRCFGVTFTKVLPARDLRGELVEHHLTTPIIEVAADARTATATWWSPGHEAHKFFWVAGAPRIAFWYFCRYSVDFIDTESGWKIWHLHVYQTWAADYRRSVIDGPPPPEPPIPGGPGGPDHPIEVETKYSLDRAPQLLPAPPAAAR